jgi:hypothetical protein
MRRMLYPIGEVSAQVFWLEQTQRERDAVEKLDLWLFQLSGFRDFSDTKEEFSDKVEEWLAAELKAFDERQK